MTNESGTSAATPPTSLGIGEQLRVGREHRCLSKTWVANQLHLHENMVDALEHERFDRLAAPVFVKGYLRMYARLLELDEQIIIQPYVLSLGDQMQPVKPQSIKTRRYVLQPSIAGAVLLLIALSLTSMWYLKYPKAYVEAPDVPPNSQGWSAVRAANATVTSEGQTTPAGHSIVFEFLADSWVKVRDHDGNNVLRGMMENGAIRVLAGKPPFDITLGNSAGVKISENGKPYDHSVHVRGNVAHFVLGD